MRMLREEKIRNYEDLLREFAKEAKHEMNWNGKSRMFRHSRCLGDAIVRRSPETGKVMAICTRCGLYWEG